MTENCFNISRLYDSENTVSEIESIEKACFSSPWSLDSIKNSLGNSNTRFLTAEHKQSGAIIGFCAYTCIVDECEILNIAVYPEHRKKGAARSLLKTAINDAEKNGVRSFFLEVRESNLAAISLYKSFGFKCISKRKNYYSFPKEDALLMLLKINDAE